MHTDTFHNFFHHQDHLLSSPLADTVRKYRQFFNSFHSSSVMASLSKLGRPVSSWVSDSFQGRIVSLTILPPLFHLEAAFISGRDVVTPPYSGLSVDNARCLERGLKLSSECLSAWSMRRGKEEDNNICFPLLASISFRLIWGDKFCRAKFGSLFHLVTACSMFKLRDDNGLVSEIFERCCKIYSLVLWYNLSSAFLCFWSICDSFFSVPSSIAFRTRRSLTVDFDNNARVSSLKLDFIFPKLSVVFPNTRNVYEEYQCFWQKQVFTSEFVTYIHVMFSAGAVNKNNKEASSVTPIHNSLCYLFE